MKKTIFIFTLFCFLAAGLTILAGEVDVTGKWEMTTTSRRGERTREIEFVQKGEKLTIISQDRDGNKIESEGTVKGDVIEWSITRETPRGEMTIKYTGKVEGDSIKGQMQVGDRDPMDWSAEKVKTK